MRRASRWTHAKYRLIRLIRRTFWYWICALAWLEEQSIRREERRIAARLAADSANYGRRVYTEGAKW